MGPGTRACLNLLGWLFIFLCGCLLLLQMYCCMSYFWINKFLVTFDLPFSRVKLAEGLGLFPPTILSTFFTKQVIFVWVPYLAIALAAIWMRHWPFRDSHKEVGYFDPNEAMKPQRSAYKAFKDQVKLFFSYQLPPRRFWAFLLEGGFNVADFVVVALWSSLNALWLYLSYELTYTNFYVLSYNETGVWEKGTKEATVLDSLGYAGAWAAVYNLVFLFMPIPRNSFLQYLFNVDFSVLVKYHRWLGHGTLWITLFHGVMYYAEWFSLSAATFGHECFHWNWSGPINNLAGTISFFPFGLVMWIATFPQIRRKFFKIFLSTHIIGFLGFMFFLEIHYPASIWYVPGLALYFMDVAFRMSQWNVISGVRCQFSSADKTFVTLNLKFNKAAKVKPTQFLFLNVPSAGRFDWHPISIAGVSPSADGLSQDVTLHLKAYGSWTRRVIRHLAEHGHVPVRVDGPYGMAHHKPEWAAYRTVVMIAGGIGVTPLLGMLREMQALHSERLAAETKGLHSAENGANGNGAAVDANGAEDGGGRLAPPGLPDYVHLIWAVRNRDELQLLDPDLLATAGLQRSWLKLSLFNTREADDYTSPAKQNAAVANAFNSSTAGPGGQQPVVRQLQPYGFGDLHWALAHLLAMGGAFFTCLLISAYVAEGDVTGPKGKPVWGAGMLMSLAFVVGAMGFPALIIYPLHFARYRSHVRKCVAAHSQQAAAENGAAAAVQNGHTRQNGKRAISEDQVERLMPEGRAKSGALDLESGKAATVSFGRPNFEQLLVSDVSENSGGGRIVVIASGPVSLVDDARLATHRASKTARKYGMKGIPELAFSNHSFAL